MTTLYLLECYRMCSFTCKLLIGDNELSVIYLILLWLDCLKCFVMFFLIYDTTGSMLLLQMAQMTIGDNDCCFHLLMMRWGGDDGDCICHFWWKWCGWLFQMLTMMIKVNCRLYQSGLDSQCLKRNSETTPQKHYSNLCSPGIYRLFSQLPYCTSAS